MFTMDSNEEKTESKLDKEQLEKLLITTGLKQSDVETLKEQKWDDISEEVKELLQSLEITKETLNQVFSTKPRKELEDLICNFKEDEEIEGPQQLATFHTEETKKESRETLPPRAEIERFLRGRSLSESLIRTLLNVGFTNEFARLLKAMGFTDEDITILQNLWDLETKNQEEVNSFLSLPSSSDDYLSADGLYLKNFLSKALACALRDMVARKPFDPIEYLGHWLLNYKICEERDKRRREFELELTIEREKLRSQMQDVEEETPIVIEREEEEEYMDDWDFLDYE